MALPSGYTQIDYIEATGTQYINTGFTPNGNSRIVMDCEPTDLSSTFCFFCARTEANASDTTSNTAFYLGGKYRKDFYGESLSTTAAYTAGKRFTLDSNKSTIAFGSDYTLTFTASSNASPMPLILMASATPGDTTGTVKSLANYAKMKLYSCKIYNNGTLVRDFVPCKNSSGVLGLWDNVNSKFYANAGTGTFATGNKHKTLIGGTGYEIKSGRVLIGGTGYDIKKGRTLIGGTGYDVSFGTPVGELAVGSSVFMNVDGARTEFIIIHKDTVPNGYSCGGTIPVWVLSKYVLTEVSNSSRGKFADSPLYDYINTFTTKIDESIVALLAEITYSTNRTNDDSYTTKAVILNSSDINKQNGSSSEDPIPMQYFENASDEDLRASSNDSTTTYDCWHVRDVSTYVVSPYYRARYVDVWGDISTFTTYTGTCYARPALAFLPEALVDSDFNIISS